MSLAPGQRLGVYEIVASLGEGGMGEVYRARDATLGREVALYMAPEQARGKAPAPPSVDGGGQGHDAGGERDQCPGVRPARGAEGQGARPVATPGGWRWANQLNKLDSMIIQEVGAFEAKTRLSELLDRVARGQVYRITKRGRPVAELRPIASTPRRPTFGSDKGRVTLAKDFDAPLPDMKDYTA